MLGNGLGLNHNNNLAITFNGVLDDLEIADNAVLIYSPFKKLVKSYTGTAIKVQRTSDNTSQWIGYNNDGTLNTNSLLDFVGSSDGLVEEIANQFNPNYNAIQTTQAYKPKIVSSGVLETNGLLFDGTDDFLNIEKYSDINLTDHPLSIFSQSTNKTVSTGYIYCLNDDTSDGTYVLYTTNSPQYINFKLNSNYISTGYTVNVQDDTMCSYEDGGTDAQKLISTSGSDTDTYASVLTERDFFNIGCRSTAVDNSTHSFFFNGYIKTIIIFKTNEYSKYNDLVTALT